MSVTTRRETTTILLAAAGLVGSAAAQPEFAPIDLPAVRSDFGASLAAALRARCSTREFDTARKLPLGVLSELLWCAYGVNRPATADRTAPSWRHARETEIFAAMTEGVWRYDAPAAAASRP